LPTVGAFQDNYFRRGELQVPHQLDTEDMESVILQSPSQFAAGLEAAKAVNMPAKPVDRLLVVGMGGSWIPAALVRDTALSSIPISIHRNYGLPNDVKREGTLVCALSYSGNTEETLSAYEAAREIGVALVGISAGGELEARCNRDGIPFVRIPANPAAMQPRNATGYSVGILVRLLANIRASTPSAVESLLMLGPALQTFMRTARSRGQELAQTLRQSTPVIYASAMFATVACVNKIKINENAKTPAFWNFFPELNHNEMIGWTKRHGAFHVVLLRDPSEDHRILHRMDITRELLAHHEVCSSVVPIEGKNLLEKTFTSLLVGDWASYELALALGVDPSPVEMVEELKRVLQVETS
jgi:glucose/mannose-6-phosphate isomerase